ncbi:MAG: TetR/AcrR family transcriptional regulator, partial [Candidatus Coatesbacteria bacterium]|nr:TetR/AcrR family transcriptional regulator [Candidatus Coatesbacteria bacterium]
MEKQEQRGRPRQDPDVRRRQILDMAATMFAERGYRASSMQEIADRLGIAKGTVYLYFAGKRELFLGAVQQAIESLADKIDGEVQLVAGPLEKIEAILRAHFGFFNENRQLAEIIAQERGEFLTHAEDSYYRVFSENARHLEDILMSGIADGVFRDADVKQTT